MRVALGRDVGAESASRRPVADIGADAENAMAPNPRELYAPTAVEIPGAEVKEAEVIDSASSPSGEVRCIIHSFDSRLTTDPSRFTPVSTPSGWFYPKKGDRAIVVQHEDGPDAIVAWWPAEDAEPDHTS